MDNGFSNEPMLQVFIYETTQNLEQLETAILSSEKAGSFSVDTVNEIFRVMHTIKGSSAMMLYNNIASLSHAMEDLFYYIREKQPNNMDYALLSDLVLEGVDFIKLELEKIKNADSLDGDPLSLIDSLNKFLSLIKEEHHDSTPSETASTPPISEHYYLPPIQDGVDIIHKGYEVVIFFDDGCEMENIRAYTIVHNLKGFVDNLFYIPADIIENEDSVNVIREHGFKIIFSSKKDLQDMQEFFSRTAYIRDIEIKELSDKQLVERLGAYQSNSVQETPIMMPNVSKHEPIEQVHNEIRSTHQSIISVDVTKLDMLMNLMGEMVIAEAMVTENPDLKDLHLENFEKSAGQLRKITNEMQDMIMSIRMVPLSPSFHKMHRIVRDMSRRLEKDVELTLVGEETEVDKNIIEHISDPLMHLVRNAIDHGIESPGERLEYGKPKTGQVTLEAINAGSDVLIIVRDDGRGLDKNKILTKALEHGLINKPKNELSDKEIYNLILLPGFSTNKEVTEFSGRGVGLDVVSKNLEEVGGVVSIDSTIGSGTVTTLKIPLTLAIIDGMNIRVGSAKYTLPTTSIRETFQANASDLIQDLEGNEMIMIRGECYPVLRLHELFSVKADTTDLTKGIMLMIEQDEKCLSLFADELLGQHQIVVKALPSYMKGINRVESLSGCTLLGDGSISLILNASGLLNI